jgi:hypothetical protein
MVLTLEKFLRQERDFQIDLALLHEVVATRKTKTYRYTLYQIQGFYAEFRVPGTHPDSEPEYVRAFEDTRWLVPYLKRIDLSALFEGFE